MANACLLGGAASSAIAAILHLGCIVFGPAWYRFFGAGERMARLSAAGHIGPALVTVAIAAVLVIWSLYALSGAGVIARLPLLRSGLCLITAIYLGRGIAGFVLALVAPGANGIAFWCWSSAICVAIGALHLAGTWQAWPRLSWGLR